MIEGRTGMNPYTMYTNGFTDGYAVASKEQPNIVYCKDCKNYRTATNPETHRLIFGWCDNTGNKLQPDDFCSRGEKNAE